MRGPGEEITVRDPALVTRREVLAAFLGAPVACAIGCGAPVLPPAGEIVGASHGIGHRIRGGWRPEVPAENVERTRVVIVGGGPAGLSAAWRFARRGLDDFVLLELEPVLGGTSRGGESRVSPFPWGAHYLPLPMAENTELIGLLRDLGAIVGTDADGDPVPAEEHLVRDPEERLFLDGTWHEGIVPLHGASDADLAQFERFRRTIDAWSAWRDGRGRRAFAIPVAHGSDDAEVTALDRLSMAEWLDREGFDSPRLRWLVDYACRDDFGQRIGRTSAWAGLFYFAARQRGPGAESQPLLAWPEGNARLTTHLARGLGARLRTGRAVTAVRPEADGSGAVVVSAAADGSDVRALRAERVVFAAPQFLAPLLIVGHAAARGEVSKSFETGPWMTANVTLSDRPRGTGFPMCWDNVLFDSPSLGYVTATHQASRDFGPTVLTYYYPLCAEAPAIERTRLLELDWARWADVCLTDLERAHPGIRSLVTRLDVMRWGHGMIVPRPGFAWGGARQAAAEPFRGIHFAHSDLSGVALFEEAFFHGVRAADEVLGTIGGG